MKILVKDLAAKQADHIIESMPLFIDPRAQTALQTALKESLISVFGEVANILEGFHADQGGEQHRVDGASAFDSQVGGSHYAMPIQHVEFCQKNHLPWCESSAIKYIVRHKRKNGIQDIKKALHYLELLAEMEYNVTPDQLHQPDVPQKPATVG